MLYNAVVKSYAVHGEILRSAGAKCYVSQGWSVMQCRGGTLCIAEVLYVPNIVLNFLTNVKSNFKVLMQPTIAFL